MRHRSTVPGDMPARAGARNPENSLENLARPGGRTTTSVLEAMLGAERMGDQLPLAIRQVHRLDMERVSLASLSLPADAALWQIRPMAQMRRLDVTPTGEYHLSLERPSTPVALLERLWREATHFALVRAGKAVVDEADVLTPTAELKRLVAAAAPLRSVIEDALWASEWPGTQRGGANFWLRGRAAGAPPFPLDARTLWRGWGEWEDLQLYKGRSLLFYVCSHEGFGEAWGPEKLLRGLGLHAERRITAEAHKVLGVPAAPALLASLTVEEPRG